MHAELVRSRPQYIYIYMHVNIYYLNKYKYNITNEEGKDKPNQ